MITAVKFTLEEFEAVKGILLGALEMGFCNEDEPETQECIKNVRNAWYHFLEPKELMEEVLNSLVRDYPSFKEKLDTYEAYADYMTGHEYYMNRAKHWSDVFWMGGGKKDQTMFDYFRGTVMQDNLQFFLVSLAKDI